MNLKTWIETGLDEPGIDYADKLGLDLCDKRSKNDTYPGNNAMTTSQIRNIFGEVKRIQAKSTADKNQKETKLDDKTKADFMLLRPKMAYAEARVTAKSRDSKIKKFREVMDEAHKYVNGNRDNLSRFVDFFEAVLAYHKFYGGKD